MSFQTLRPEEANLIMLPEDGWSYGWSYDSTHPDICEQLLVMTSQGCTSHHFNLCSEAWSWGITRSMRCRCMQSSSLALFYRDRVTVKPSPTNRTELRRPSSISAQSQVSICNDDARAGSCFRSHVNVNMAPFDPLGYVRFVGASRRLQTDNDHKASQDLPIYDHLDSF